MGAALRSADPALPAQPSDPVWREGWWVRTQPAGMGESVVKHLACSVGRTVITDERFIAAGDEKATGSW